MHEPQIGDIYRAKTRQNWGLRWVVDDIEYIKTPFHMSSGIVVTLNQEDKGNAVIQIPIKMLEQDFLLEQPYLQAEHMDWYGGQSS